MRVMNIASGSSGNATYIGTDNTHVLIDSGISRKRLVEGLAQAGLSLGDIDAILVTHEHIDHISSIGVIERTREIPIFATAGTVRGIKATKSLGDFPDDVFMPINVDGDFIIGDLKVRALSTFHDANEPCCYRLSDGRADYAIVTDLGEFNQYLIDNLKNLSGIMIEANHDVRMLEVGPYPYPLKKRILGKYGHLSNEAGGDFLARLLHQGMRDICLGHLSKENNTPDLALMSVMREIDKADNPYSSKDFKIKVAHRDRCSELIELRN